MNAADAIADLRLRVLAIHGEARADHAVASALLAASLSVYDAAHVRLRAAEEALAQSLAVAVEARETAEEWRATVQGLMLDLARRIEAGKAP